MLTKVPPIFILDYIYNLLICRFYFISAGPGNLYLRILKQLDNDLTQPLIDF